MGNARVVALVFSTFLAVLLLANRGESAQMTPDLVHLFAPESVGAESDSLLDGIYIQEKDITQETQPEGEKQYTRRRAERYEVPGPPYAMPERPFQFGFRFGVLLPVHSLGNYLTGAEGDPDSAGLFGLDLRFPVPFYEISKLELSFDMNMFEMDLKYNAAVYDIVYEDYFDIIFSYLGSFSLNPDFPSPVYWGIGVGWARETIRYNLVGSAGCDHFTNDSTVFQLKLGWDSGQGVFVEVCYKKLLDSDRNIDNMWGIVVGLIR